MLSDIPRIDDKLLQLFSLWDNSNLREGCFQYHGKIRLGREFLNTPQAISGILAKEESEAPPNSG